MPRKKVILDTDTGVDDAMAIILALHSPELDVRAITTVAGNASVEKCTKNILRVLTLMDLKEYPPVARRVQQSRWSESPSRREACMARMAWGSWGMHSMAHSLQTRSRPSRQ
jgi:inosine-uridine nucleoside N-ribohydrolase